MTDTLTPNLTSQSKKYNDMKNYAVLLICLCFASLGKGQVLNEVNNNNMDIRIKNYFEEQLSKMKSYYPKPMYYIQVNKQACRVLVSVNNILLGIQFVEDEGESMLLPINDYLLSSGNFEYGIEVLPMKGKEYLTSKAWVEAKIYYLDSEEKPLEDVVQLGETLGLPTYIEDNKLSVYKASSNFTATLPYDYSERLKNARDLSTVPDLEQKVLDYYNKIHQWMLKCDLYSFLEETKEQLWKSGDMYYDYEKKESFIEGTLYGCKNFFYINDAIDRKVIPIENYKMYICGNGKLVQLLSEDELESVLRITYFKSEEQKKNNEKSTAYSMIMLYIPEGSDDFKPFY